MPHWYIVHLMSKNSRGCGFESCQAMGNSLALVTDALSCVWMQSYWIPSWLDVQVLIDVAGDCLSCVIDSSLALRIELATYRSTLIDWRDANPLKESNGPARKRKSEDCGFESECQQKKLSWISVRMSKTILRRILCIELVTSLVADVPRIEIKALKNHQTFDSEISAWKGRKPEPSSRGKIRASPSLRKFAKAEKA